ncbi:MAG: hypothetical protein IT227_05695 [Flavobacteriales bacterium]|nr:hypothetical protein [Flavobacteriales bacterium]
MAKKAAPKSKSRSGNTKKNVPPGLGAMHDLHKLLEKQQFGSMAEIEAFMEQVSKGPIPKFEPGTEQEEAEELVYRAMDLEGDDREELLMEALDLDPECIAAYHALGAAEHHPAIAIAFYERGISLGAARFESDEYIQENKGHFWGLTETRPFMRCLQGAADCQFFLGKVFEAMGMWFHMLELNPNDNQGVRYDLMLSLAGFGDHEQFEQLDKQFEDDASAAAHFNRVLNLFTQHGPGPQALQTLDVARAKNKHMVPLLLKKDAPLYRVTSYTSGSEEEAIAYMDKAHLVWSGVPGAKEWLKQVAGK